MSGLHQAFDEIVADAPVYGDLDRAVEQAERDRRHRYGMVAGLAAAAAVLIVIAGIVALSRDTDAAAPISPSPTPSPTLAKSQSPETWADTAVAGTRDGAGWDVPDPLKASRDAWLPVVAGHLDPQGEHLELDESDPWGVHFVWPGEGSESSTEGRMGLMVDRGDPNLFDDGCRYLGTPPASNGTESCSTERLAVPDGERARISRYGRRCGSWDPGREGDDARPGPGSTYATCGDYKVAVAVERRDGLIGYVVVDGRGTPDFNPFSPRAMAAAAADPRLTLPETAYAVPSDQAVVSVVADHFPRYRAEGQAPSETEHPGYADAWGKLGRLGLSVTVQPAGGTPACGNGSSCAERRVFGADDPTTVFVGAWDYDEVHGTHTPTGDLGDSYPKYSRASQRQFVYVGPRHTVVVSESLVVKADEESLGADLDQRVIDLLLDPRLQ